MEEYLSLASEDSKLRSEETSPFPPKSDGNQVPIKKEPSFAQWCTDDTPQSPNSNEIGVFDLAKETPSSSLFPTTSRKVKTFLRNPTFAVYVCRSSNDDNAEKRSSSPVSFDLEIDDAEFNGEDGDGKTGFDLAPPKSPITMAVLLKTLFFVFVWYALSSCLTIYNKTLLGEKLGKFPAPLLMNALQFSMQAVMSNALWCYQIRNAENAGKLTWNDYFLRVIPTAIGTALDINLSNASLMFISVTFATMCKSGSPIFLLLFAFAFRLEAPSVKLFGIISIISFGVLLTVRKETEFHLWGFIFIILATIMSGFRWSLTQILLQKETYGLKNPITLMSYVTPIMTAITLILSLFIDPWHELDRNSYFDSSWHVIRTCLVLLIGGMLAFCMVLTEYILVSSTSAVTVSIAGVIKEAITILVAVFYFDDRFTLSKAIGLLIIMVGVSLFNLYKYQKLLQGELSNREDKPSISDRAAKYLILDEMDIQDREI